MRPLLILLLTLLLCILPSLCFAAEPSLNIGIFPRRNAKATKRMFQPLVTYLGEQLNRDVNLIVTKDFDDFWFGVKSGKFDLVHLNQYHYVKSHREQGYQALVMNEEFGVDRLSGALYVRRDSGITDTSELRGKKILFGGGRQAFIAYISIRYLLQQGGLAPEDYTEAYAKNPPNAILATYFSQVDAGGAGDVGIKLPMVTSKINPDELMILAQSHPLPHLPWAVRANMPDTLKTSIQRLMTGLKNTPAGVSILKTAGLSGLVETQDADYAEVRKIIKEVTGEVY